MLTHRSLRIAALGLWVLGLSACGDKPKNDAATAKASAPATAVTLKTGPLEAPESVIAYGGTNGLAETLSKVQGFATKIGPLAPFIGMLQPDIVGMYRLKDPQVIDPKKPLRFALFNPLKFKKDRGLAVVVGITSEAALLKALPKTGRTSGDAGNELSYLKFEGAKAPIYVNMIEGFAVFTTEPTFFPQNKAFFTALSQLKLPALGGLYFEVDNHLKIFGKYFDRGVKKFTRTLSSAASAAPGGADQIASFLKAADLFTKAAREVDHILFTIDLPDDGFKLDIRVTAKKGAPLEGLIARFAGKGTLPLLSKVPADAAFFFGGTISAENMAWFASQVSQYSLVDLMFAGDAAKAKPYLDAMLSYTKGLDGEMVIAAHQASKGGGLALNTLFGVRDAKVVRAAQSTLLGLYTDPAVAPFYEKSGVAVDHKAGAYKVGEVSVDTVTTRMNKLPPSAMPMMGMMQDLFTQHIAIGDKMGVIAYGKTGREAVEGFLGGQMKGGLDQVSTVQRALKNAAKDFSLIIYLNPLDLARRLKLGGMNPLTQLLSGLEAKSGFALSAGVNDGALQVVFDLPLATILEGVAAFEKSKSTF